MSVLSQVNQSFKHLYGVYRISQGFSEGAEEANAKIRSLPEALIAKLGCVYDNSPSYLDGQPTNDPMDDRDVAKRLEMMRRGREARLKPTPTTYDRLFVLSCGLTRFGGARPSLP